MANIVGIRFKKGCKIYYFNPAGIELGAGDSVVVKTARGQEMGQVAVTPREVPDEMVTEELRPVLRKAEEGDLKHAQELEDKARQAMVVCDEFIKKLNLPMKLLSAEYNMEGNRVTFLFSAEERVDFRELVRELNSQLKTKVELRQVGPRDEAKMTGGFGRCGRPLCCMSFLNEFAPVSIRMAKDQNLPLNPMKISGVCGRLLCCLTYEVEQYRCMRGKLPRQGQRVSTPLGEAIVVGSNPLLEKVIVELETKVQAEVPLSDITVIGA